MSLSRIVFAFTQFSYSHTPLSYVRLPLPSDVYIYRSSGQRPRTSVPRHGQRLHFRPCTPLISYPIPHPAGILGHNGCADVLRMLAGCGLHKERQSLVIFIVYMQTLSPTSQSRYRLYSCLQSGTCQSAHRLTDRQEPGRVRKAHISQSAHAPIRS